MFLKFFVCLKLARCMYCAGLFCTLHMSSIEWAIFIQDDTGEDAKTIITPSPQRGAHNQDRTLVTSLEEPGNKPQMSAIQDALFKARTGNETRDYMFRDKRKSLLASEVPRFVKWLRNLPGLLFLLSRFFPFEYRTEKCRRDTSASDSRDV